MQDHTGRMSDMIRDLYVDRLAAQRDQEMRLFHLLPPPEYGPDVPDRRVPIRRIQGRRRREEWDRDYDY